MNTGTPASAAEPLRVGLITDSREAPTVAADMLRWCTAQEAIAPLLVIVPRSATPAPASSPERFASAAQGVTRTLLGAVTRAEQRAMERRPEFSRYVAPVDLASVIPDEQIVELPAAGTDGTLPSGQHVDILVALTDVDVPPALLQGARLGALSFRYGDPDHPASTPPFFRAVLQREPATEWSLVLTDKESPLGVVLRRGSLITDSSFLTNETAVTAQSAHHVQEVLDVIVATGRTPEPLPVAPPVERRQEAPTLGEVAAYAARRAGRLVVGKARGLAGHEQTWSVGFQRAPWDAADLSTAQEIPNPPGSFLADPFVVEHEGKYFCFVEEYPFETGKGIISAYALDGVESHRIGVALEEDFHLSFPFLFHFEGDLYMCPETMGAHEIRVYKSVDFPLRWEHSHTLMRDVDACDTMLFPQEDGWWLLTNLDPSGLQRPGAELYAFRADSPLTDHWAPHPANPLVTDAHTARNGGLLTTSSDVVRVAQKIGFTTYGAGVSLRRLSLDSQSFTEEEIREITPTFRPGIQGNHHMHSNGTYTVFDYFRVQRPR